jgi:hydroxymethylglutaryl-CoA synthase
VSRGIVAWGVYLPYWRLQRSAIGAMLGAPPGKGTRSVASYDEDTTTLGVEAARRALAALPGPVPLDLFFSTPAPAYLDKTNAAVIHSALDLPASAAAYDLVGSVRSGAAALRSADAVAGDRRALAVLSDLRTGLAGSAEERDSGDGAVAFVFGSSDANANGNSPGGDPVVAELVGHASATAEFLDRWRAPGDIDSRTWEERFGEAVYVPLVEAAWADALKRAGVLAAEVDHVAIAGLHPRAVQASRQALGTRPEATLTDRSPAIGNLGAAQPGLLLADALEQAAPGALIALVVVADGADVFLWRTTSALPAARAARESAGLVPVSALAAAGRDDLPYARFLTWRGQLQRDPPRRPDPERPGAPATWRSTPWKGAFKASGCRACGFRHLPPARVCLRCRSVDDMEQIRLADVGGRVATFTVDRLAFSLSPPVVGAVVDFDGGGRYRCEMTDVDPESIGIGTRVEMTFRRLFTAKGVHNYFWKARPAGDPPAGEEMGGHDS